MNPSSLSQKSINTNGATIYYWTNDNKSKPTIFLMHGAAMDHDMFEPQFSALYNDYNVVAWDARGHGASRPVQGTFGLRDLAMDCLAVLDALSVEKAILVGQSEGGMVAQEVYRLQPGRVKAIATIGASPIMLSYSKFDIWLLKFSAKIIKVWPYENFMKALAQKTAVTKSAQQYAMKTVKNISQKDFLSIWDGVTTSISHKGIPGMRISVPLLITYGDSDTTGTVKKNNQRWKQYEPNAELVVIPRAGHNANQDNAPFFNELLVDFLHKVQ